MTSRSKHIFTAEPVQWATDYIFDILETLEEGAKNSDYGLALLALEREELRGIWHELNGQLPATEGNALCLSGRQGTMLFVIRQLLVSLPPLKPCLRYGQDETYQLACKRLTNELFFLAQFRRSPERKAPAPELVKNALRIIISRGMAAELLLNGSPLHIYCLNYVLPQPTSYIFTSHTILCGSSDFDENRQLQLILYELGRAIYAAKQAGKEQPACALREKTAEQFTHHFAASHLSLV
ncbi:MAG: hypothetical protein KGZ54_04550 [Dethiobacter sp.]|nr:hypothetical protein [Dethiobacter sp.]MBS3901272.1 hypothetical protein [Dethiobacter sp.]MBS3990102.1 hypothetical protein [Dethiobacter sp.]